MAWPNYLRPELRSIFRTHVGIGVPLQSGTPSRRPTGFTSRDILIASTEGGPRDVGLGFADKSRREGSLGKSDSVRPNSVRRGAVPGRTSLHCEWVRIAI